MLQEDEEINHVGSGQVTFGSWPPPGTGQNRPLGFMNKVTRGPGGRPVEWPPRSELSQSQENLDQVPRQKPPHTLSEPAAPPVPPRPANYPQAEMDQVQVQQQHQQQQMVMQQQQQQQQRQQVSSSVQMKTVKQVQEHQTFEQHLSGGSQGTTVRYQLPPQQQQQSFQYQTSHQTVSSSGQQVPTGMEHQVPTQMRPAAATQHQGPKHGVPTPFGNMNSMPHPQSSNQNVLPSQFSHQNAAHAQQFTNQNAAPPQQFSNQNAAPPQQFSNQNTAPPQQFSNQNAAPPQQHANQNTAPPQQFTNQNAAPPQQHTNQNAAPPQQFTNQNAAPPQQYANQNAAPPQQFTNQNAAPAQQYANQNATPPQQNLQNASPALQTNTNAQPAMYSASEKVNVPIYTSGTTQDNPDGYTSAYTAIRGEWPPKQESDGPNQTTTYPSGFKLKDQATFQTGPAKVVTSQPAFKITQPIRKTGDTKWPPRGAGEPTQEEVREFIKPKKSNRNYEEFFSQNALPHNYAGYRAPPGTQHRGVNEEEDGVSNM